MHPRKSDATTLLLLSATLFGLAAMGLISAPFSSSATPGPASALLDLEQTFGAEANPTGNPIGGGSGYHDIITSGDSRITYTVTTKDELLAALQHAGAGDVVYLEEIADINLTDTPGVTIPAGVTLAGNRGATKTFGSAVYSFTTETSEYYAVWSRASASGTGDPFWTSIDGEESHRWYPEVDLGWQWNDERASYLSAGQHTLTIQWREGGPNLDEILITSDPNYVPGAVTEEQPGVTYIRTEAESGAFSPPMGVASDPTASGGTYIRVPERHETDESMASPGGRISLGKECSGYPTALVAGGENVRVTGIRLEGPDTTTDEVDRPACGIFSTYRNLEVDNCELLGWNGAAISLNQTGDVSDVKTGGYIHHNYFHHNQGNGLGYGVMVTYGSVCLVEANYFDYCRHAIAGSGLAGDGYEARYNICGPNWPASSAHNFDMHGKPDPSGSGTIAGDWMLIHHNTFMVTEPENSFPIMIQGVPRVGAYIHNNWFYYTQEAPVWQSNGKGNVSVASNLIGPAGDLHEEGPVLYL